MAELADWTIAELLAARTEGRESLVEIAVDARPRQLSELGRRELHLDERPAVRPNPERDGDDEDDDDDEWDDEAAHKRRRKRGRKPRRPPTPTLDRIATPWHRLAVEGRLDAAFERDVLVADVASRLRDERPEPLVLVGPAGVGKTAVLHAVARRLNEGLDARAEPDALHPLFFVDGARLIAGEGFSGDWQHQVLAVLKEAFESRAALCLGHVIDLLDAGKTAESQQHVAQLLAPALAAGEVRVVAEATPEAWARVEERNGSFARLFTVVRVEDPPPDALGRILGQVARRIEETTAVAVAPEALEEARALCARLLPYGAVVGNTVTFLRRLTARAPVRPARLGRTDVVTAFAAETGVPEALLRDDLPLDGAATRAFLRARVKGQEAAVDRVGEAVSIIKANLAERRRPVAVLLFAGPTGVGKTELAKALSELVFGARERLVRLDMGEYAGGDALARLMGDTGLPGHLTASLRRQPFSLVLLDEIEKAHPAVFDALLGVFGEGRLTDATGRTTDFRNAVFVLTSNLGADTLRARRVRRSGRR
jgi:ATP-dependent Clp protease ATP-binding subunit ClpA